MQTDALIGTHSHMEMSRQFITVVRVCMAGMMHGHGAISVHYMLKARGSCHIAVCIHHYMARMLLLSKAEYVDGARMGSVYAFQRGIDSTRETMHIMLIPRIRVAKVAVYCCRKTADCPPEVSVKWGRVEGDAATY